MLPDQSALFPFSFAGGDKAKHLSGPAGHLLTPAPAYVRAAPGPAGRFQKPTD